MSIIKSPEQFKTVNTEVCLSMEKVLKKDDDQCIIAYRVRLVYHSTITGLGQMIYDQLERNEVARKKRADERLKNEDKLDIPCYEKLLELKKMNIVDYKNACIALGGLDQTLAKTSNELPVNDQSSPFYPTSVFNIDASLIKAYALDAREEQCMVENYFRLSEDDPTLRMGLHNQYPECNYFIGATAFSPYTYENYEFPFVHHPEIVENKERTLFHIMNNIDIQNSNVLKNNIFAMRHMAERNSINRTYIQSNELDAVFNRTVTKLPTADTILTLDGLRNISKIRNKEIKDAG